MAYDTSPPINERNPEAIPRNFKINSKIKSILSYHPPPLPPPNSLIYGVHSHPTADTITSPFLSHTCLYN